MRLFAEIQHCRNFLPAENCFEIVGGFVYTQGMSVSAKSVDSTGYSITRAVLYVCLIIFPFIILYIEMERFFALEIADRRSEIFDKAGRQLLRFSEYTDDARFFHLLLQKSFAAEATRKNTQTWLAGRSQMLKKLFPETFTFISGIKAAI
ncbi:MAG TPA: hypothetical protein PKN29_09625 [Candidatus Ozemobacteraceae bacterium]|nr:hypothetical protein [Candidatus Ozemobacteraceae bacterium]